MALLAQENIQGFVSCSYRYRCELRALSPTAVPFLLLVSGLKGEDIGEESSGCQSAGLSRFQGQHDENSAGSGSSVRISPVSRQLPHRNKTGAVEKPLNNYSQYVHFLPWSDTIPGAYVNCNCKAVILCESQCYGIGVFLYLPLPRQYLGKDRTQVPPILICNRGCILEFGKELPFTAWWKPCNTSPPAEKK